MQNRRAAFAPSGTLTYGLLANFGYPPNRDAFERLVRQWLPVLRSDTSRIVVAGFGSELLPHAEGLDIIGQVDEVAEFYDRVDVVLAPIARGGGMKVKVVEAMMNGVPVVTTKHAKEGLPPIIANACIDWERLSTGGADLQLAGLRDPREMPPVAAALKSFTVDSFVQTFSRAWQEQMHEGD
jgi:glycosyltransferase involved in cell wall biosynthesis